MSPPDSEVAALFGALESHRAADVAAARTRFAELLGSVREAWLVAGLVHYYAVTGSVRAADVLARAPAPHHKHLLQHLAAGLRQRWRTEALALLGHVVRRQPLWLHTICDEPVFRDLLQLLKTERDLLPLMSGLLALITLLPMVPTLLGPHFHDVFEVFARLAAWEHRRAEPAAAGQREHLQFALYALFQNLYGMFPCNFVDFLKREYGKRDNREIFTHTVKPMLESVKVHPLLITASKTTETDGARWKKMEHHDVLVECRRFSSESARKQQRGPDDERRFRARCGTDVASLATVDSFQAAKASNSTPNLNDNPDAEPGGEGWFSLTEACGTGAPSAPPTPLPLPQDAPAPPGPEPGGGGGSPPEAAIEATPENTPVKDARQRFNFPAKTQAVRALGLRPQGTQAAPSSAASHSQPPSPLRKEPSPLNRNLSVDNSTEGGPPPNQTRLSRVLQERSQQSGGEPLPASIHSPRKQSIGSPLKKSNPPPPEDNDVVENDVDDDRDAVESIPDAAKPSEREERDEGEEPWAEDETPCVGEDPPCTERKHGLHMPPSASMIGLVRRVARNRFHSQCVVEPAGCWAPRSNRGKSALSRRSSSCPEFETTKNVAEAQTTESVAESKGVEPETRGGARTQETQTVEVWPLTYEHMFTDILQNVCDERAPESSAPEDDVERDLSPYREIDKYVEVLTRRDAPEGEAADLKRQLELLHLELLYERHRREVHAFRNRRLLGRSRKNREAEEANRALKQQVASLEAEIIGRDEQIAKQKRGLANAERKQRDATKHWQQQAATYDAQLAGERRKNAELATQLLERRDGGDGAAELQRLNAALFDATQQMQRATRRAELGERQVEFVKRMQRELIICGERDAKYKEALLSLPSKTDAHINRMTQQYREQLASTQSSLQQQTARLDLLQGREVELEAIVASKDLAAQELKRQMRLVKEEYDEKLKSLEDKYQSVKRINQRLEAHALELLQRAPQSPQTISRDLTSGFSPQSSPLSASLASSEGHGPLLSRVDEMRNLQVIVNAHETIEESTSRSTNSVMDDDPR